MYLTLTPAESADFTRRCDANIRAVSLLHLGTRFVVNERDEQTIKRWVLNQIWAERDLK
jgi:hypothetical protein